MPYKSRWSLSTPDISIPSFTFGTPSTSLDGTKKILIDAKRPDSHYLTLLSYREWSKRFAAGLLASGLEKEDRVMLFSGNSIYNPIVVMGTLMAGGIYNSANPAYTPRELCHQLNDSRPRFILAAANCYETALEAAEMMRLDRKQVFLFNDLPTINHCTRVRSAEPQTWSTFLTDLEAGHRFVWEELNSPDLANTTAALIYSSGTTGLPKGVELSHRNFVANMLQVRGIQMSDKTVTERRSLCVVPMYHALGLGYYIFSALGLGLQTYFMERYHLPDMLEHISQFRITELMLVPPILVAMAKHPSVRNGTCDISSVRKVIAGAAPIGMEVTHQFEALWDRKVLVRQGWAMSEVPAMTLCWDERSTDKTSSISVGELVAGAEAKLVKDDGEEETRPGCPAELWIRSPNVMKGYWHNSKATQETLTSDGWLKTGDIAYRDADGKWYMIDRKKELIKVRGAQVAPAELEALLLEHPKVIDAAVIGLKTATDEYPRAYVVLAPGTTSVVESDIVRFVNARVSKIKHITGGVVFMDTIPKNPSGKILRRQLRERAAKETTGNLKL